MAVVADVRWSRKHQVAARYSITTRSVDRKVQQGLLPAPEYPCGPHLPLWRNSKLEAHDAAAVNQSDLT
jgi:hypothetical protein